MSKYNKGRAYQAYFLTYGKSTRKYRRQDL